jgi:hypothetical protein
MASTIEQISERNNDWDESHFDPIVVAASKSRCWVKGRYLVWLFAWAAVGLVEGFVVTKSLVPYPKVLADQFVFQNCIVLKMFMSAVGFSMLAQSAMASLSPEHFTKSRFYGQNKFGYGRVTLGAAILGVGMAIAGSGPTMIAPAMGGSVETAWWLVIGALAAAMFVGLTDKACERYQFATLSGKPQAGPLTLEALVERCINKKCSYTVVAGAVGSFLVAAAIVLEAIFNFQADARKYGGVLEHQYPASILNSPAWPPTLAGLVIGAGQVPVRMITSDGMGGATSCAVVISTLSCGWLSSDASLFKAFSNGWQIVYNYGWVLGGAVLARLLNTSWALDETTQPLTNGFQPAMMTVGAFLAVTGARIAGGCTCGHGVSGTSKLSIESFVGAGAIFGAAIATRSVIVFVLDTNY